MREPEESLRKWKTLSVDRRRACFLLCRPFKGMGPSCRAAQHPILQLGAVLPLPPPRSPRGTHHHRRRLPTPVVPQYKEELDLDSEKAVAGNHRCCAERRCVGACLRLSVHLPLRHRAPSLFLASSAYHPASAPAAMCCRLLQSYVQQGRRQGVPAHKLVAWVRRKLGGSIVVWRRTADGQLAYAAPCLFCSRELKRFDLQVHCALGGGEWWSGKLSDAGAPQARLTGGQQKVLRAQGWILCDQPLPARAQPLEQPRQQQQQRGPSSKQHKESRQERHRQHVPQQQRANGNA